MALSEARKIHENAIYKPPAACGDIYKAAKHQGTKRIGLIDGVFHNTASVWHKEVLYALESGIAVFGSSSMGALRASELAVYGMIGLGDIYDQYVNGVLVDDDEVALLHGPESVGYAPITIPMINVREAVRLGLEQGKISSLHANGILSIAKSIYYGDRHINYLQKALADRLIPSNVINVFIEQLKNPESDLKYKDARKLLEYLSGREAAYKQNDGKAGLLEHTKFWNDFVGIYEKLDQVEADVEEMFIHAYLTVKEIDRYLNTALLYVLSSKQSNSFASLVTEDLISKSLKEIRYEKHLNTPKDLNEWLADLGFGVSELRQLVTDRLVRDLALQKHTNEVKRKTIWELEKDGRLLKLSKELKAKRSYIENNELKNISIKDTNVSYKEIELWYLDNYSASLPDKVALGYYLGYTSSRQILNEVLILYVSAQ